MSTQTDIGNFVRSERRALGWTQEKVALYAGVSAKFIVDVFRSVDADANFVHRRPGDPFEQRQAPGAVRVDRHVHPE